MARCFSLLRQSHFSVHCNTGAGRFCLLCQSLFTVKLRINSCFCLLCQSLFTVNLRINSCFCLLCQSLFTVNLRINSCSCLLCQSLFTVNLRINSCSCLLCQSFQTNSSCCCLLCQSFLTVYCKTNSGCCLLCESHFSVTTFMPCLLTPSLGPGTSVFLWKLHHSLTTLSSCVCVIFSLLCVRHLQSPVCASSSVSCAFLTDYRLCFFLGHVRMRLVSECNPSVST